MSIYQERLHKVRQRMEKEGVELLFLSPSPYMFYVTGIRHPHFDVMRLPGDWLSGVFISQDKGPIFIGHWMMTRLVQRVKGPDDLVLEMRALGQEGDPLALLKSVVAEFKLRQKHIAVADHTWTRFTESLRAVMPEVKISLASELMDMMMAVQDEEALRRMRKIAEITDAAYQQVVKHLRVGVTEEEMKREVDYQLRRFGSERNSFSTGVVFTRPGDVPPIPGKHLLPGDSVTFDFGGVYEGYSSDFGRSAFVGEPPAEYLKVHELVLQAQAEAMKAMKPGRITCEEVDAIARKVIADKGYGDYFTHRLGHGISITVHNRPFLDSRDKTVLQSGMTFTVEPSIRVAGRFSNRVEDDVVVTDEGAVFLTTCSRELYIVD